jgi:hypothetical protein
MEIVIALELIVGAVFVVGFWYRNPELMLSRHLSQPLLDPYDDEENDDARVQINADRGPRLLRVK